MRQEGGIGSLLKNQGGFQEGEGPRGREGVCGELGKFWGGGGKFFFFRAETSTKFRFGPFFGLVCRGDS